MYRNFSAAVIPLSYVALEGHPDRVLNVLNAHSPASLVWLPVRRITAFSGASGHVLIQSIRVGKERDYGL